MVSMRHQTETARRFGWIYREAARLSLSAWRPQWHGGLMAFAYPAEPETRQQLRKQIYDNHEHHMPVEVLKDGVRKRDSTLIYNGFFRPAASLWVKKK